MQALKKMYCFACFQYFSFTLFSMALNEITEENASQIPPTDSRLRPDIRLLEQGQIGN